ncbi:15805_t:CDS:2, partial [Racocetra fulgida]
MDRDRFQRFLGAAAAGQAPVMDTPTVDNAEMVYISSLALLKASRAGVPMEVMGLMLGEFVDDYTVRVIDVFAMPQSGTGVSVEAVDPVFQTKMLDMLKQTGRFEQLNQRAVAVVVDPIQSVKGKVVIDAFRLINPQMLMLGQEPRQTTSNIGHLNKPSIQEESTMTADQLKTRHVGKQDPKRHLEESVEEVMSNNIVMALGTMIDSV